MDIESRKISFMQEFLTIQSEEVLSRLENLLRKEKEIDFKPMSTEQLQHRIDLSLDDSENDRIVKASDLKSKYE